MLVFVVSLSATAAPKPLAGKRIEAAQKVNALLNRAAAFIAQKKFADAIAATNDAIRLSPNNARAYRLRGQAKLLQEFANPSHLRMSHDLKIGADKLVTPTTTESDPATALKSPGFADLSKAIELAPHDNEARLLLARSLTYADELKTALGQFDDLIKNRLKSKKDLAEAWYRRAACTEIMKGPQASIRDYDRAIGLASKNVEFIAARAWAYSQCGMVDKAIAELTRALAIDDTDPNIYAKRGTLYNRQGKFKQGYADHIHVLQMHADETQRIGAHNNAAQALLNLKDFKNAYSHASQAIALIDVKRTHIPISRRMLAYAALVNRAFALIGLRRPKEALVDVNRVLVLASHPAETIVAYNTRYWVYKNLGELRLADQDQKAEQWHTRLVMLKANLKAAPRSPNCLIELADHFSPEPNLDNPPTFVNVDRAIALYGKATAIAPKLVTPHKRRARLLMQQNKVQDTIAACDTILRLEPTSTEFHLLRGEAHFQRKQYDAALRDFEQGRAFGPHFAKAYLARAKAHEAAGRKKQAAADRRRAAAVIKAAAPVNQTASPFPK